MNVRMMALQKMMPRPMGGVGTGLGLPGLDMGMRGAGTREPREPGMMPGMSGNGMTLPGGNMGLPSFMGTGLGTMKPPPLVTGGFDIPGTMGDHDGMGGMFAGALSRLSGRGFGRGVSRR